MDKDQLRRQVTIMRKSLFDEGYLDEQRLIQLEGYDNHNPNFLEEKVKSFLQGTDVFISTTEEALERNPPDFHRLYYNINRMRVSCLWIGAQKVVNESNQCLEYLRERNVEACIRNYQQLKNECVTLRQKLESYFQLVRQALPTDNGTT